MSAIDFERMTRIHRNDFHMYGLTDASTAEIKKAGSTGITILRHRTKLEAFLSFWETDHGKIFHAIGQPQHRIELHINYMLWNNVTVKYDWQFNELSVHKRDILCLVTKNVTIIEKSENMLSKHWYFTQHLQFRTNTLQLRANLKMTNTWWRAKQL